MTNHKTPSMSSGQARGAVDEALLAEALSNMVGWEPMGYDDRKELASTFQDYCVLPDVGLSEAFYEAVIAVANAGYDLAREHALAAAAAAADAAARTVIGGTGRA